LFATETAPTQTRRLRFSLNWLAPVTVCTFTMLMIIGGRVHSPTHLGAADTNFFFASITMNSLTSLNSTASLKSDFSLSKLDLNLEQNVWRMATFASTNLGQSPSSMGSLPFGKTNSLIR
jgi:hypothetical protein